MSDNPNYNWNAWNELSTVEEHLKELYHLTCVIWGEAKNDEELQTSISGLLTFTNMVRDEVSDVMKMIGPRVQETKAA